MAERLPTPAQELVDPRIDERGMRLLLKRDDLIDPTVPGNKWRKLEHNLLAAEEQGRTTLLTFGGAYSNHIRAVAGVGRACGFRTVGVIRGDRTEPLNWSLSYAASQGMQLTYLDRETYRHKHEPEVLDGLRERFGDVYVLPEGGSNALAVQGCAELPAEITAEFDVICCPCGTGGTLAGIAAGLPPGQRVLGFSVLRPAEPRQSSPTTSPRCSSRRSASPPTTGRSHGSGERPHPLLKPSSTCAGVRVGDSYLHVKLAKHSWRGGGGHPRQLPCSTVDVRSLVET